MTERQLLKLRTRMNDAIDAFIRASCELDRERFDNSVANAIWQANRDAQHSLEYDQAMKKAKVALHLPSRSERELLRKG